MGKTIWILNHYATDMMFNQGGRHYSIAKYLRLAGYNPVVFGCNSKHNSQRERYLDTEALWVQRTAAEISVPFVFVRGRVYQGNGKDRWLNMLDFFINVQKTAIEYGAQYGKPDCIYASSVHPLTVLAGIWIAKYYKIKCIGEIRDIWPESIVEYGIAGARNPLVLAMRKLEQYIYQRVDVLIFTGEGYYDYIKERKWEKIVPKDKVFFLNNGVDLETFDENRVLYQTKDVDLLDENSFKVVYTGSIRRVNNLGLLLDAAKCISNPKIRFLIWGNGDELEMLKNRTVEEKIDNVIFKGHVDKKHIPYITSRADLNIAHNEPSPLFRFGISFNKLFDYLAAGKPVLCDFPSKYNPAIIYEAGIEVANPSAEQIAIAVEKIAGLSTAKYRKYCDNARAAVVNTYNYRSLTNQLIQIMETTDLI